MPVPSSIDDLSQTAGSNSPPGSESPTTADDYLRSYASFIALLRDGKGHADEAQVASAATCDIGAANSLFVEVTGTTTITSFGMTYNGPRFVRFSGVLTLTHNATSLILPGGANITTAAGDTAVVIPNAGTPNGWRVIAYQKVSLAPGAATSVSGTIAIANGGTGQTTASAAFDALKQAASETATGVVELATDAEAQAGTDTARAITAANLKAAQIQYDTAVTLTTQTSVDFTSIPSWAKRITVVFSGVSTNGTSPYIVQIGDAGGIETSSYLGSASTLSSSSANTAAFGGTGFVIGATAPTAATTIHGTLVLTLAGTGKWIATGIFGFSNGGAMALVGGEKTLSASPLDRVRLTTVGGTDQFDAGTVNVTWE